MPWQRVGVPETRSVPSYQALALPTKIATFNPTLLPISRGSAASPTEAMLSLFAIIDAIKRYPYPHEALNYLWQRGYAERSECHYANAGGQWTCSQVFTLSQVEGFHGRVLTAFGVGPTKAAAKTESAFIAVDQIGSSLLMLYTHRLTLQCVAELVGAPICRSSSSSPSSSSSAFAVPIPSPSLSTTSASSSASQRGDTTTASLHGISSRKHVVKACLPDVHDERFKSLLDRWEQDTSARPVICALDVEVSNCKNDQGFRDILQVGFVVELFGKYSMAWNMVIEENVTIVNRYCPTDHDAFIFGETKCVSLEEMRQIVHWVLDWIKRTANGCVVGHTLVNDITWLQDVGLVFDGILDLDISEIQRHRDNAVNKRGLAKMAELYNVHSHGKPHNAGNDAVVTMAVFREMVYGERPSLMME